MENEADQADLLTPYIRQFVDSVAAAVQAVESARPGFESNELREWLYADPEGRVALTLCRSASVAACMAFARVWFPSGKAPTSWSIHRLRGELRKGNAAVELPKEGSEVRQSLSVLRRWRDKRIAHRDIAFLLAQEPTARRAMQSDLDRALQHAIEVVSALRTMFPDEELPDLVKERELWCRNASAFWQRLTNAVGEDER